MRKALLLLISHIVRLGPVQGIRVLWIKKLPKGKLRPIDAPWLGGRLWLRPGTADINTIDQILIGPYMPVEADWDPGTVIDCGANIGLATRYLQHAYPEAHIIAVEPEEGNFELLCKNMEGYPKVECVRAGIWPEEGKLQLQREGHQESAYRTEAGDQGDTDALTIPGIMQRYGMDRIGLLKVDIEGSELELFCKGDLGWIDKVDRLSIELHDWFRPGCGNAFFKAISRYDWNFQFIGHVVYCTRVRP
ncbi:MAG: FkbM family methyltransferase [Flavobacteriales bacterium]|nr:FkbM family methyltransferase [Flavobacteriales bacterium]MBK7246840.1 FkbM family methyltransferase [Flavobacteriales bacterium]MBK7287201.1 FkbM family methyltransferase [Flavobacteriales bacterium]